jgi:4-amino-4-deoxy-L-arabinose transferase-like glycosyltransferase
MKTKTKYLLLGCILVVAALLRLYQLGVVPPSPDWDEVALGYDAYSIIHTGKDEYGAFLPVVLRSFDDYKPALYTYLAIPPVAIFGLNIFAVRLPSALFGIGTVLATFFLVRELFKRDEYALIAAGLLAISPWHVQFSRVGFESNVGVAFNVFAALFFLKGLKKPWLLLLSAVCAGLALYVYQSEKVFTPLLMLALVCIYWRDLFRLPKKYLAAAVITGLIVVFPMIFFIATNKQALLRVSGTSVFSNQTQLLQSDITRLTLDRKNHDLLGLVLDNRRVIYAETIVSGYLSHFDFNWLFMTGDIARHHAPSMGLLYLWELPFLLVGIYLLIFGKFERRTKYTVFAWFLLAPVPASITTGVPHAVRTLNFLPMFQIFIAIGIITIFLFIRKHNFLRNTYKLPIFFLIALTSLFIAFNVGYYLNQYFVQLNYFDASEWQYGYQQAIAAVPHPEQYQKIIVSDEQPMDKSYMFFLFYLQYQPQKYQEIGQHSSGGFAAHHAFANYEFRPIKWSKEQKSPGILYIGRPQDFGSDANVLKTIYYSNGEPAMKIVQG